MAVINCNEDSFYSASRTSSPARAVEMALKAEEDGADIIDFGAESTRPGADYIDGRTELKRLIPAIEAFRRHSNLAVSVDTRKAAVAGAALDAGADIINDISALEIGESGAEEMLRLCAERAAPVILMHKKGNPPDMQNSPWYSDVVLEVKTYLLERAEKAAAGGIKKNRIMLDPGIGFGKRVEDNLRLINHLAELRIDDYPVVIGLSRKSFLGELTGRSVEERLAATIVANAAAVMNGANIIRVHDVREAVDLVKVLRAAAEAG